MAVLIGVHVGIGEYGVQSRGVRLHQNIYPFVLKVVRMAELCLRCHRSLETPLQERRGVQVLAGPTHQQPQAYRLSILFTRVPNASAQ